MKYVLFIGSLFLASVSVASADCNYTTTTGVGYFGAKQNCEVILQGQADSCQPEGFGPNALWACKCTYGCSNNGGGGSGGYNNHTVTTGVGYFGAKQNCEVILRGNAYSCEPQGMGPNALWTCQCDY